MSLFPLLSLMAAMVSLTVGTFVVAQHSKSASNRVFFLLCLSIAYVLIAKFVTLDARSPEVAGFWLKVMSFWPLILCTACHFALIFAEYDQMARKPSTYLAIYGPGLAISLLTVTTDQVLGGPVREFWGWTYEPPNSLIARFTDVWAVLIVVVYLSVLLSYYLRQNEYWRRQQARLVFISFAVPVVVFLVSQVSRRNFQANIPDLSHVVWAIALGFIAYAIWNHRLSKLDHAAAAEQIVAAMSDAMLLIGVQGEILSVNGATLALSEYDRRELIGEQLGTLFGDAESEPSIETLIDASCVKSIETTLKTKSQGSVHMSLSVSPVWDGNGRLQGAVVVGRDLTDRMAVQEALQQAHDRLESLVETRTAELEFTAEQLKISRSRMVNTQEDIRKAVAQQLHGPVQNRLLVAINWLQSALKTMESDRANSAEQVARATELVQNVNEAELRSAVRRLHPSLIRLSLESSLQALAGEFGSDLNIEVTLDRQDPETEELWRRGLPEELRLTVYRVAEEALGNAFKHAHATAVELTLSRIARDRFSMSIQDNGTGFDPETTAPGFGILSMQDYCGAANGTVQIMSRLGEGTTVVSSFSLSVSTAHELTESQAGPTEGATLAIMSEYRGQSESWTPFIEGATAVKVLIVDDQPDFCDLVQDTLKPYGSEFQVVGICFDGNTALTLVEERRPDLVLLDVEMPDISGVEVSRMIRHFSTEVKVVLMSAYHQRGYMELLPDAGAVDFIPKAALSVELIRRAYQRQLTMLPVGQIDSQA